MKRFLGIALVVAGLAAAGPSEAQVSPTPPTHVFTTIDSVSRVHLAYLVLVGVLADAPGATQATLYGSTTSPQAVDHCERAAHLVMSKPGMYRLEVWVRGGRIADLGSTTYAFCRLSLANP